MKILNFGSCNIDTVCNVQRFVQPGETARVVSCNCFSGGKGLNQSIAISKAGAHVYHAGCIGKDDELSIASLKKAGVDTTYLRRVNKPTGQAFIQVDSEGQNAILVYSGANAEITTEYIDSVLKDFNEGDVLLVQNEISNLFYLIDKAAEKGMKIILNPSPFEKKLRDIDLEKLYCVILNETEATEWIGTKRPYDFLSFVKKEYPNLQVLLTLGGQGSTYFVNNQLYRQHAYKVPAVDTTAAGDTFTGYFVAGICKEKDVWNVLQNASVAAALAVSREGASASIPDITEVQARIPELKLNVADTDTKQIIESYIRNNLEDVTISDLEMLLHYTDRTVNRLMRKYFGKSFVEYLQYARCERAASLLADSSLTIGDIIRKVGYANENFFRKKFLEQYHMLPMEYRRQLQREKEVLK